MSNPNIPLLRKYVEWVEEQAKLPIYHPEREWNQGQWFGYRDIDGIKEWFRSHFGRDSHGRFTKKVEYREPNICQTSYCVAGRAALDAGYTMNTGGDITGTPPGQERHLGSVVSIVAAEILGLDIDQANDLFNANNTAVDVHRLCEAFAEEAGEKLY